MAKGARIFVRYLAVLAALVLVVAAIFGGNESDGHYTLVSNIKRTDGLTPKSRVLLSGVDVGYIEGMTLRADYTVDVEIKVKDGVKIPSDSATAIYSESLMGGKYLAILPGGSEEYMGDGAHFDYSQNSIDIMNLISIGADALKKDGK